VARVGGRTPIVYDPAVGPGHFLRMASCRKPDSGARACCYPMLKSGNRARGDPPRMALALGANSIIAISYASLATSSFATQRCLSR
jgi:hypothetical protein